MMTSGTRGEETAAHFYDNIDTQFPRSSQLKYRSHCLQHEVIIMTYCWLECNSAPNCVMLYNRVPKTSQLKWIGRFFFFRGCTVILCRSLDRYTKHSNRLIILDDVLIQFDLLMMSALMLETCRDMK